MRRKERAKSEAFALRVLDLCDWAVISMVDTEGQPYCLPVTIVREDFNLYFHCAPTGFKIDCLRAHPTICLTAVSYARTDEQNFTVEYDSVIARGTAEEITDEIVKIRFLKLLCERHTPTNMGNFAAEIKKNLHRTAVWKLNLTSLSGKSSRKHTDLEDTATSFTLKEA